MHYLTGLLYINYYTHLCFTLRSRIFYLYVQPTEILIKRQLSYMHIHIHIWYSLWVYTSLDLHVYQGQQYVHIIMDAICFTYNCSRPCRIFVSFGVIQINPIQNSQIDQQKKLKAPASRKRGRGRGGKHLTSKRARDRQDAVNARKQKLQVYDTYIN